MNHEIWKLLVYPDIVDGYMISSYGRIKSAIDDSVKAYEPYYHSTNGYDFQISLQLMVAYDCLPSTKLLVGTL